MNYLEQWAALSNRIRGLVQAGQLQEKVISRKYLLSRCEKVFASLTSFRNQFQNTLPTQAQRDIDEFIKANIHLTSEGSCLDRAYDYLGATLVLLSAFETEMSFFFSDVQPSIRSRTERAFAHLQRSLEVDPDIRRKWCEAFEKGETECEKLGAVHLLLHGIWAFKVDAVGERTDLVYKEPVEDIASIQSYADGLVLTEWKKADTQKEAEKQCEQARSQMNRYRQGALGGTELTGYRYAVIVTKKHLKTPLADITEGPVVYRPINLAVDPAVPSKS